MKQEEFNDLLREYGTKIFTGCKKEKKKCRDCKYYIKNDAVRGSCKKFSKMTIFNNPDACQKYKERQVKR